MFKFFEAYMPECWDGLVKRGFIRKNSGIRFCQNIQLDDDKKFNSLAAEGTPLFNLVKETGMPFYIDRLQGGVYIDEYRYDQALLEKYRDMLGEKFYGFQLHEWVSNLRTDILHKLGDCENWTREGIEEVIFRKFPFKHLFLEAMTADEMARIGRPTSADDFYSAVRQLFDWRIKEVRDLIPCDSFALAYKLELDGGARAVMPEVGAQTRDSRLQISYAAGISHSFGREFGVYYEPWGGDPFSTCCYQRDGINEWNIGSADDFPFEHKGPNGGSSRSLQKRVFQYAYLSGAGFISEEWGMCNTFCDWDDFEVSPYGRVKLDFHSFTEKYPDPGRKLTPVAVVLPAKLDVLEDQHGGGSFCGYPLSASDAASLDRIKKAIVQIFCSKSRMLGRETSLINSDMPDAVTMVHADAPDLDRYEYLVDLTCDPAFAKAHSNLISVDEVKAVLSASLPCNVEGDCHWMVNRKADGGHYIAIWNHDGVTRSVEHGESVMPEASVAVRLTLKDGRTLSKLEGSANVSLNDGVYTIEIPGGDWFFGEF